MLLKLSTGIFTVLLSLAGWAQISIIPQPVSVVQPAAKGSFNLTAQTVVLAAAAQVKPSAGYLNTYLQQFYGWQLAKGTKGSQTITLLVDKKAGTVPGAYRMEVSKKGIVIKGYDAAGVFYGIQSLLQLLPVEKAATLPVPFVQIIDQPRFQYRGMHLDAGRHFFPADFVKKYIDYLALHKMNYFHWHLTEDQGWRLEIKKYPRLAEVGGFRNGTIIGHFPGTGNDGIRYGGYYTQQQVKEIVAYAAARYITIIPEIELPGHSSAAIAAYPELSCFPEENTRAAHGTAWSGDTTGKYVQQAWGVFDDVFCPSEKTFAFLQNVMDEVIALFPGTYIHIGGDECPKENWKRSPFCQQLMKEKGLKNEHELQSYFIRRIEKYLNSKGRQIIGWDEILEGGLAPNATIMSWRGEKGGIEAAQQQHKVIMTPESHTYFNYAQTSQQEDSLTFSCCLPVQKVYSYEPLPKEITAAEEKYIWGAQANLWSEYIKYGTTAEYQLFPRLSALSEVLWSTRASRNWEKFAPRLEQQFRRYDLWNVHYSKAFFDPASASPKK